MKDGIGMNAVAVKLGVALGMVAAVASFLPLLKLFMGRCFFEQGCGNHETFQLVGVALVSCLVGFIAAWCVVRLARFMTIRKE